MKKLLITISATMFALSAMAQEVRNTSYITSTGEKVLRLEITVPADQRTAWQYFVSDAKLKQWVAPLAHMDLKTGGYLVTNYDSTKSLDDKSSIRLKVVNYIEGEMLTLKVKLNGAFPEQAQKEDENLQEVIQLIPVDSKTTIIRSSMIGWGTGPHWDKTYGFFEKGNIWTYQQMQKLFR